MNRHSLLIFFLTIGLVLTSAALVSACSSGGGYRSSSVGYGYGVGYRGYYGRPWGGRPIYVGGGAGGLDRPVAVPLPEMGRPDFGGGFGMDSMDMGGFDW